MSVVRSMLRRCFTTWDTPRSPIRWSLFLPRSSELSIIWRLTLFCEAALLKRKSRIPSRTSRKSGSGARRMALKASRKGSQVQLSEIARKSSQLGRLSASALYNAATQGEPTRRAFPRSPPRRRLLLASTGPSRARRIAELRPSSTRFCAQRRRRMALALNKLFGRQNIGVSHGLPTRIA